MYRTARLQRLAKSIPWNLFLGSINVYIFGLWLLVTTHPLIPCAVKEEDAEAQHTVHDGEGAVQSHILNQKRFIYRLLTRHDSLPVWLVADK
jgi:hypothetical protein